MPPEIVMKFGGTSLGTADAMRHAAALVAAEPAERLVVCSAVGGVTDLLIAAGGSAQTGLDTGPYVAEIHRRHDEIVAKLGLDADLLAMLNAELARLIEGVQNLGELTPRVSDMLVSLGERASTRLFAAALTKNGTAARAWDAWELGLSTNDRYGCAETSADCGERMAASMRDLMPGMVHVVTGFIGRSTDGEITTLGRGGSDLSAALFGAAAGAREIQIWTDVPGILRADPRLVAGAGIVPEMLFEEAAELAYFGARVLHPRTIEPARQKGIPVRVLGTFQVDPKTSQAASTRGTLVHQAAPPEPVRAIAMRRQARSLHMQSTRMLEAPGFLARVFGIFERHGISVDVIATSEVSVSMTFDRDSGNLPEALREISAFAQVDSAPERSILCLVGAGLRDDPSLLARIFSTLARNKIPVEVISQGASRINITLVLKPAMGECAMRALHAELFGVK
ncbi:MAG TPA: aspartate kinase [Myxococcota bacterium]|nr:aspartate kinase [Myxococcota bacterium]